MEVEFLIMGKGKGTKEGKKQGKPRNAAEAQRGLGFFRKSGEMGKIGMGNSWVGYMKFIQGFLGRKNRNFLHGRNKKP